MLTGKSRLAVWRRTDQTVRLFEMDNTNVFVQRTAFSGPTGADVVTPTPLAFSEAGDWLLSMSKASKAATNIQVQANDFDGNLLFSDNVGGSTGTQDTYFPIFSKAPGLGSIMASRGNGMVLINDDGTENSTAAATKNIDGFFFNMNYSQLRGVVLTSTALRLARLNMSGRNVNFTFTTNPTIGSKLPLAAEWTRDGRFCAVGYDSGDLEIYSVDSSAVATLLSTTNVGEAINQVKWRFDNRILAVGHGTTPNTTLYKRKGNVLYTPTTLGGIGSALHWTADGQYLLDPITKKAYHWDSDMVMSGADAIMVNIVSAVTNSAISPHVDVPTAAGLIYDVGFQALVLQTVDLANLKLALLDGTVLFDPTSASASDLLAANEVYSNPNFPQGGLTIQNAALTFPTGSYGQIAADDILVITSEEMSFGQVLIYDATSNKPLVLFDYGIHVMDSFFTQQFTLSDGFVGYSV